MTPEKHDPYFYGWREWVSYGTDGSRKLNRVPLTEYDLLHPQEGDFHGQGDFHSDICIYLRHSLTKTAVPRGA